MKIVPNTVKIPRVKKIYPISHTLTIRGIETLMTNDKNQFKKVPILTALSYIISAIYSHTIGPEENSKNAMNKSTQTTIPIEFLSKE